MSYDSIRLSSAYKELLAQLKIWQFQVNPGYIGLQTQLWRRVSGEITTLVKNLRTMQNRAEKSKSLIRWKMREKAEKADLVMQLAVWQKCQNAMQWQNACTLSQGPASEYFF